jgi:hypothetical protein
MARSRRPRRLRQWHFHRNPRRRDQTLLLIATTPPTDRVVLVNGFDAWVETANGTFSLSSQCYALDAIGGDGAQRIEAFS